MPTVDIWLNAELDRGSFGPLNQLHESLDRVKFGRDGFIEVQHEGKKLLIPPHKVDHVEILDR